MTMSDRDKKLLAALVPIVVIAAYWFLLLSPKREEATTASATLTEQQERLDAARAAAESASGAEQGFEASYAQIVRLGKAIPSTVDMPSLLVQLDAAAAGTGISFTKISAGERVESAPAPATPPAESSDGSTPAAEAGGAPAQSAPGTAAEAANNAEQTSDERNAAAEQSGVDAQTSTSTGEGGLPVGGGDAGSAAPAAGSPAGAGLETIPLELEFTGNFFNLADFFHRVKRFVRLANQDVLVSGRLITIDKVSWASDAEIFPRLRAQLTTTVYLSPKAEGVTAGATPSGPAPTPAAGGTTAPAEPTPEATPTPTATASPQ
jgi:Tfp pilus assembly protein PilO